MNTTTAQRARRVQCEGLEDPNYLWDRRFCLAEVSKNVRGRMALMRSEAQMCADPSCQTLKTDHNLRLQVEAWTCDSPPSNPGLDGIFFTRQLVTAFTGNSGMFRGHHTGNFEWIGQGVVVRGSMSGMTNVGTHRVPSFQSCQDCDELGWLEGQLCGHVVQSQHPDLVVGCAVTSAYRFQLNTTDAAANRARLRGVFEGVTVCPCHGTDEACVDFNVRAPMAHANPWVVGGHTFHVHDHTDQPTATAEVVTANGINGLNVNVETRVALNTPVLSVEVTLVHFAEPPTVEALGIAGNRVDIGTITAARGVPETLSLSDHGGIDSLTIKAPQADTLLLELCAR